MEIQKSKTTILEYIWIGGNGEIRSKTKVLPFFLPQDIDIIPNWNYDGSSTWQADSNGDTEILLIPCAIFNDPFRIMNDAVCYLVLCETSDSHGNLLVTNNRHKADTIFHEFYEEEPWFGLEQEYFINFKRPQHCEEVKKGYHYCGNTSYSLERIIAEQHLQMCVEIGIKISGINAEVSDRQWEFQIGPCEGIDAGDDLIIARYLLERIAEKYDATINYEPKPYTNINGSGCHINFSTVKSRRKNGIEYIDKYIERLGKKHSEHIAVYGSNNHLRLTGLHETSSIDTFSWGIGTRNTSIRIPNQTFKDKCGYLEDRRPASNIDHYLATSIICRTCCSNDNDEK